MDLASLKSRVSLLDVVSPHVALKRAGSRYRGLCPFHAEKNPSFFVDPGRGAWKCYGCGEGGDALDFVQKRQGLDFLSAAAALGADVPPAGPHRNVGDPARRRYRRELVERFRRWEVEYSGMLAFLIHVTSSVLARLKTQEEVDGHGALYHDLTLWRYHFDILCHGSDADRFWLWRTHGTIL